MPAPPCPVCGCADLGHDDVHRMAAALAAGDVDAAIGAGLLQSSGCPACADGCTGSLIAARDERRNALAARERHRARQARLQRRAEERAAARAPAMPTGTGPHADSAPAPSPTGLPSAAAQALARAKARAAERHKP